MHFYAFKDSQWTPCHTVPYADPNKGMRDTTLADAKKMGLFPSVTGIVNVVASPNLGSWKVGQALLAALTLPRERRPMDDYMACVLAEMGATANDARAVIRYCYQNPPHPLLTDDEHAKRVAVDMEAQSEAAKKLGTEIHDVITGGVISGRWKPLGEAARLTLPVRAWIDENVTQIHAVEQIVGSVEHGYAGTMDLDCELKGIGRCVLDWKSQNVKRNGTGPKPEFYFSYGKQLAAYCIATVGVRNMATAPIPISIIIDKANGGEVFVKIWRNPAELWEQFLHSCAIWRFENDYDPRVKL